MAQCRLEGTSCKQKAQGVQGGRLVSLGGGWGHLGALKWAVPLTWPTVVGSKGRHRGRVVQEARGWTVATWGHQGHEIIRG